MTEMTLPISGVSELHHTYAKAWDPICPRCDLTSYFSKEHDSANYVKTPRLVSASHSSGREKLPSHAGTERRNGKEEAGRSGGGVVRENRKWTHSEVDSVQVGIALLQPIVEVLCVVGGVPLPVGGHAEDSQRVVHLCQARQLRLGTTTHKPSTSLKSTKWLEHDCAVLYIYIYMYVLFLFCFI